MALYEVTTSWGLPSGIPTKSYMYFDTEEAVAAIRARLGVFFNELENSLSAGVFWSVDPSGKIFQPTTGALVGEWSDSTVVEGEGAVPGEVVADATQVNIQWNTGLVVGGRFLRGRTYIPGLSRNNLSGGNMAGATRTAINTAADALAGAPTWLSVWHRPVNGAGGLTHAVTTATVRSELAVLRKRRNRSS